jgi:hypothetical protein
MPKLTLQQRLVDALVAGGRGTPVESGSRKYVTLKRPDGSFFYVGKTEALAWQRRQLFPYRLLIADELSRLRFTFVRIEHASAKSSYSPCRVSRPSPTGDYSWATGDAFMMRRGAWSQRVGRRAAGSTVV